MAKKYKATELVEFCRSKIGTAYVYGMKGEVMTQANFNYLHKMYGDKYVPYTDIKKVGKVCVDCSGLISWACGIPMNSAGWENRATVKKPINTISSAPVGALLWMPGHIGVYLGKVKGVHSYIAADGSKHGVRIAPISANRFTHWLLVEDVFSYEMEDDEMVTKEEIIVDGKKHQVEMIRKDGVTFIKTRDLAEVLGLSVSSKGKIPVLDTK